MDKRTKTQKINDRLDQAKQAAEIGKMVGTDRVDRYIDRGTEAIDAAKAGLSLIERFKNIFRKRK